MPELIVMMPVRNVGATVRRAVSSTLRALPNDASLVIYLDGSTDETADVVGQFSDRRIQLLSAETSGGGGAARRAIMAATDSRYVASMDGDDLCFPWRFRKTMPLLEGADIVFGGVVKFGPSRLSLRPVSPFSYTSPISNIALLFHCPFSHPTVLAHRSAIEGVGGYSTLRYAQDYELWLRAAANGKKLVRTGIPVVAYRRSSAQVTARSDFRQTILTSPELLDSYQALYTVLMGHAADLSSPELIAAELRKLTSAMPSGLLHAYYSRLAKNENFTLSQNQ